MSISFSGSELINIAIGIERRGIAFYDTMTKSTKNAATRRYWRPRGAMNPNVQYIAYLVEVLCPRCPHLSISHHKLPATLWSELLAQQKTQSLRELAEKYGVSYESVRRVLVSAKDKYHNNA